MSELEERATAEVGELPVLEADYTYMGEQTLLSVYHTTLHGGAATVVESKGASEFVVRWTVARFDEWGVGDCRCRTDKENSVIALAVAVKAKRKEHRTLL